MTKIKKTRRLEFTDDKSHKFWQYTDIGDGDAIVEWGRIGSKGQSQNTSLSEAEKRYFEKQAKGYSVVASPTHEVRPIERKSKKIDEVAADDNFIKPEDFDDELRKILDGPSETVKKKRSA